MKLAIDPKAFFAVLAVVLVVAVLFVVKGANAEPHTPLPDPAMFKKASTMPTGQTAAPTTP